MYNGFRSPDHPSEPVRWRALVTPSLRCLETGLRQQRRCPEFVVRWQAPMACVPPIERVRRGTQFALLRQSICLDAVALHQLPKYSVQKLTGPTQAGAAI